MSYCFCGVCHTEALCPFEYSGGQRELKNREWVATLQYWLDRVKFIHGYAEGTVQLEALKVIIEELKKGEVSP
ncbi:MAG: hypothetical protein FWG55_07195 [Candidatus Bathyarchaeota archaeon]|nr:hypothetical protein [Candidatus Termiticorpusculum sp.]